MRKVGLKYCGGCNPSYDRVAYVQRIREAAAGRVFWSDTAAEDCEVLLFVSGCERACAEQELPLVSQALEGPDHPGRTADGTRVATHAGGDILSATRHTESRLVPEKRIDPRPSGTGPKAPRLVSVRDGSRRPEEIVLLLLPGSEANLPES